LRNEQNRAASGGIAALPALIEKTFPLPRRFRAGLSGDVAELSRLLTSARPEREAGYLGRPRFLSAYLRYFLLWNVFRLQRVLSLDAVPLVLSDGDAVTDLGSGPLTLPIALWLARPELRKLRLEFRCIDRTGAALEAGKKLFLALAEKSKMPRAGGTAGSGSAAGSGPATESGPTPGWIIKTIRGPLDTPVYGGGAKLVCAINVFNEVYRQGPPGEGAEKAAALLGSLCAPEGAVFAVEPGNPRGGAFIAGLRSALPERTPLAPCPHHGRCPLSGGPDPAGPYRGPRRSPGGKAKWCHFAFDTGDAPAALCRLSEEAGIPKDRAAVSFLLAGPAGKTAGAPAEITRIRVISDPFPLPRTAPGLWGRYGCSERGLVLVTGNPREMEQAESGALLELPFPKDKQRDPKTGALVIRFSAGTAAG
jgi:hypothetical protein